MGLRETGLSLAGKVTRDRFYADYVRLKHDQWLNHEALEALQMAKLKKLIAHAIKNVPFYERGFAGFDVAAMRRPDDMRRLPVLTKEEFARAGKDAIARNSKRLKARTTSGTSGPPFRFVVSRGFFSLGIARHLRMFDLAGLKIGDPWVICTPLRFRTNPIYSLLTNRLVLDANQITQERTPPCCPSSARNKLEPNEAAIRRLIARIQAHRPKAIFSYPSMLTALAIFIRKWNVPSIRIPTIISSGELLSAATRRFCEETFEAKVYNLYGTTEFPTVAQECSEHQGLHIFNDSYYVEFLDDGAILITDLDNYTMPFIRFNIGDHGFRKDETCTCGRALPLMEITRARTSDLLITRDGKFLRRSFFAAVLEKNPEIAAHKIVQSQPGEVAISVSLKRPLSSERRTFLEKRFLEYAGQPIAINFQGSATPARE